MHSFIQDLLDKQDRTKEMKQTVLDSRKKSHRKIIFSCNSNNQCRRYRGHGATYFIMVSVIYIQHQIF